MFPSTVNSIKDIRGYFSCKYIWVDESDYVPENVVDELIHAITPYQTKSNAKIILSSTAFKPNGLMQTIELDHNSKYFKLRLPYQLGLNSIYDSKDIELRKNDVEFQREFELHYVGRQGNLLTGQQIDLCQQLGRQYDTSKIPVSLYTLKSVGIDPGFSSSSTGIIVLEHIKEEDRHIIRVIDCHLIDKGDPNKIVELCWSLYKQYGYFNTAFFIDGSNRAMVNLLKIKWGESLNWENIKEFGHNSNIKIRPVNFSTEHKNMLSNLHAVISKNYLAIDKRYDKPLTSLRTAYCNELSLDKRQTSYSDLLDGLRLGLKAYNFE